jgi:hypothetical protein
MWRFFRHSGLIITRAEDCRRSGGIEGNSRKQTGRYYFNLVF